MDTEKQVSESQSGGKVKLAQDQHGIWVKAEAAEVSFPDDGHENLIHIEENSFWFAHRNEVLTQVMKRFPFEGDFVDIGGGNGFQLARVQEANSNNRNILLEPGYTGCLNARKRNIKDVYNIAFQDFNFSEFNVGGLSLLDVVEHIEDDVQFLKELKSCLTQPAKIYITVPAHQYLWSDVDDFGGHFRRYNEKMVQQLAKATGFNLTYFSYFFSYLTPISYVMRAVPYKLGYKRSREKIIEAENTQHAPSGMVKSIFDRVEQKELKKLEQSSIKRGASCLFVLEH